MASIAYFCYQLYTLLFYPQQLFVFFPQKMFILFSINMTHLYKKKSNLFVSSGRPSLLTLRGMAAPLSSLSAERVFPTELPRLMARLGVCGCGEAVSDC